MTFQDGSQIVAKVVYAKYGEIERLAPGDNISSMYHNIRVQWMVREDFNVIMNKGEKIRRIPVYPNKSEDFPFCINYCDLVDIKFKRSSFTWWNVELMNNVVLSD